MKTLSVLFLLCGALIAQQQPAASSPAYQYFAETGALGNTTGLSSTTGFGLRIGTSNVFWVTDVDTQIQKGGSVSTIRTGGEYHVAVSGRSEFLGFGAAGVTVDTTGASAVGLANFSGGFGLSYDVGAWLSKGKIHLPVVGQFRINDVTATSVKTVYCLMFRKTF